MRILPSTFIARHVDRGFRWTGGPGTAGLDDCGHMSLVQRVRGLSGACMVGKIAQGLCRAHQSCPASVFAPLLLCLPRGKEFTLQCMRPSLQPTQVPQKGSYNGGHMYDALSSCLNDSSVFGALAAGRIVLCPKTKYNHIVVK